MKTPAIHAPGLSEAEDALVNRLMAQLDAKRERNVLRTAYYDSKRQPDDLGVTMPPGMLGRLGTVLGWPAKAVDTLAQRVYFQGFSSDDATVQGDLDYLVEANRLEVELQMGAVSALEHGCAFLVSDTGDHGEPAGILAIKDALNGTGDWDVRRRALSSFLSVIDRDPKGAATDIALYLSGETLHLAYADKVWTLVERETTGLDYVPVELLPWQPTLERPFGRSRISRPIMRLTDSAIRTVFRAEMNAEFYAIPQRWLLGADASDFGLPNGDNASAWKLLIGRVLALPDGEDKDGNRVRAEFGQFPSASQQPHIEHLKMLAQQFAGEASLPVSSLGVTVEANPTSAEAYQASREDIIALAENTIRTWRGPISRAVATTYRLAGGPDDAKILARYRDPRHTSQAAAADAFTKNAAIMPWLAETDLAVELLGYDETTTERLKQEKRRIQGRATVNAVLGARRANTVSEPSDGGA